MARETVVRLTDDLDGGPADETILFGLDGINYEIDLATGHANSLRAALEQYVRVARPQTKSESTIQKTRAKSNRDYDPAAVRAWAISNKVKVPERGRIPLSVIEQFKQAGN